MSKQPIHKNFSGNWDSVAYWYDGWMGSAGSEFHRKYAIPFVFDLIEFQGHERTLDVGCGQGVLAPSVARASRRYIGIDISRIMIGKATKRHSKIHNAQFIRSNVADIGIYKKHGPFDVAIMLLCIQDMPKLRETFQSISAVLKPGGQIVIVMTHPCFRTPRMTGWGFDPKRKQRIDGSTDISRADESRFSYTAGKMYARSPTIALSRSTFVA
jgi:ubiquinone/menaquinone biosynthesis C-methylase UbiE